ncbi:hypothetical protein CC78DRAFT_306618 [Lojkania enalia]|uniref:Uncharacterized protein n=1 Tax=Lojkania enalia TaxID=147567 RepID=A0A9P4TQ53_9PLEO|nr:hypothetical protein CC78DRAFT_306618 [Didymosphaeria enalia]
MSTFICICIALVHTNFFPPVSDHAATETLSFRFCTTPSHHYLHTRIPLREGKLGRLSLKTVMKSPGRYDCPLPLWRFARKERPGREKSDAVFEGRAEVRGRPKGVEGLMCIYCIV